jgi:hypothetical protein
METTGLAGRIQISQATADLLEMAGKKNWFTPREEQVMAKGKGKLQTYWLKVVSPISSGESVNSSDNSLSEPASTEMTIEATKEGVDSKTARLVKWAVDAMQKYLVGIEIRRQHCDKTVELSDTPLDKTPTTVKKGGTVLDEVVEIIRLPNFSSAASICRAGEDVKLEDAVVHQLKIYVQTIAQMYNHNAFHNFEHAMHVTNSTIKLLNRIVSPEIDSTSDADLHDHTYGITSDPLTQFACVFSALIHDGTFQTHQIVSAYCFPMHIGPLAYILYFCQCFYFS